MPNRRRNQLALDAKWVDEQLKKLTGKQAKQVFQAATRSGASVFARQVRKDAPDSGQNHKNKLKESISVKKKNAKNPKEVATWVRSTAPHAHLVEYGTQQRYPKAPYWAFFDGELRLVTYMGSAPSQPFFRPAIDSNTNRAKAMISMKNTVARGIMRNVRKNRGRR